MIVILTFLRTAIKSSVILMPLLGLTWIIGLFAVNENTTVFAWLFTILNSFQVPENHSLSVGSGL